MFFAEMAQISQNQSFFAATLPEPADLAGYAWLIQKHNLVVPLPSGLTAIAHRHHPKSNLTWQMLTPRHAPNSTIAEHLEFALKWEGVNLAVLASLFKSISPRLIVDMVTEKPRSGYTRKIWFLYEWLTGSTLPLPDAIHGSSVPLLDHRLHLVLGKGILSRRHKVIDNLPGTRSFCPLVRYTRTIAAYQQKRLDERAGKLVGRTRADVVARAAAFLLLSDSKASFSIEGELPSSQRAARWAQAIGEAGRKTITVEELERLQKQVIGDSPFVKLGLREDGGFVGEHDRDTGAPIPQHISAREQDVESLVGGLVSFAYRTVENDYDAVAAAAALAFGFVYIHPFQDGNGRIHRWLIHHALARAGYNPPGLAFPISATMLADVDEYRRVLESYSSKLLPLIQWEPTEHGNLRVLNETADYYRYFDATAHAEYLYKCIEHTVNHELPEEVLFLESYDSFAAEVQDIVEMPARTVALLHRFLQSNSGRFSKRARDNEFNKLSAEQVQSIEALYDKCFGKRSARLPPVG